MKALQTVLAGLILLLLNVSVVQAPLGYHIQKPFIGLAALWVILSLLVSRPSLAGRRTEIALYLLWSSVVMGYGFATPENVPLTLGADNWQKLVINWIGISICYAIGIVHSAEGRLGSFMKLRTLCVLGAAVTAVLSVPALLSGDLVAREFLNTYQDADVVRTHWFEYGLGDAANYNSMAMATPVAFALCFRSPTIKGMVLWGALGGAMLACIFLCSLLAMILAATLGVLVLFLSTAKSGQMKPAFILGLFVLVFYVFFLTQDLESIRYARGKIEAILGLGSEDGKGERRVDKRADHYSESWESFKGSPILGIGARSLGSPYREIGLGGHSGILDGFGLYGLLFLPFPLLLVLKTFKSWQRVKQPGTAAEGRIELAVCAAYVLMVIINPITLNVKTTGTFLFLLSAQTIHTTRRQTPKPKRKEDL